MTKSIRDNKKSRGRPKTTGTGELLGVRLQHEQMANLDAWIARQGDKPSRPEAVRRLIERALKSAESKRPYTERTASNAATLAGRQIDQMRDETATSDEFASRKRRILKGPKEFRDIRADLDKRRR
jgi:hypothetical protein